MVADLGSPWGRFPGAGTDKEESTSTTVSYTQLDVYKRQELQQAVKEAQPFFASLDSLPIYNKGGKQAVLKVYSTKTFSNF